ncbi:hypothetical protein FHS61_001299 [Altererythrobacter atlanticus]|uniref:Uncharacterized protein n=1 Tax=Croceibacterium atlanticum TaxID=1267766 RepID=A0A0F7KW91_9SPHN|nr:cytochrome c [Croceibacterium atlanticum]AKH43984.1 hypothetical protein WYH_02958 [Croceibacterium atlanticum]MBB5732290.1 hypothetical protein [Croceibacterium atlanticum]
MRLAMTLVLTGGLLTACAAQGIRPAAATGAEAVNTREAMVAGINPAGLAIWAIRDSASDDRGHIDPARMNEDSWKALADAGRMLETYSRRLAEADSFRAEGTDVVSGETPEGIASREEIQQMIDANPAGFRAWSAVLEQQGRDLVDAAHARDAARAGVLAYGIDSSCSGCHEHYWFVPD